MFSNRKFSMNRHTGVPRPARRFSIGEPSINGEREADSLRRLPAG